MTRPDDIPEDVWDRAADFAHEIGTHSGYGIHGDVVDHHSAMTACARAILAERERCANIATAELRNMGALMSNPPQSAAAWDIRNAIRAGIPCP